MGAKPISTILKHIQTLYKEGIQFEVFTRGEAEGFFFSYSLQKLQTFLQGFYANQV